MKGGIAQHSQIPRCGGPESPTFALGPLIMIAIMVASARVGPVGQANDLTTYAVTKLDQAVIPAARAIATEMDQTSDESHW